MSSQMNSKQWDDPPTDDDSDDFNEGGENDDDKFDLPEGIDEDDFFEFVLKEGLKLSPEEIEQYRADNFTKSPSSQDNNDKNVFKPDFKGKGVHTGAKTEEENNVDDSDSDDYDFDHYGQDDDEAQFPTLNELRGFREDLAGLKSAREILDGLISETAGPNISKK